MELVGNASSQGYERELNTLTCPVARRLLQRLLVEELTRQRPGDDYERYLETFRRATVDANPHQIEAVVFALNRLSHGGALMCDEVGLGKTIEAGLVISELRSRGADRILIVVPLSLARQWQVELEDLFSVPSVILDKANFDQHDGRKGVFIVGRELAGSETRAPLLKERGPWDLIVVDEAHEMLGGLYKRYRKRSGLYQGDLKVGSGKRAGWLKHLIDGSPVLLLTATPLQNNLFELWSLVQFLDQDSTVLGPLHEFAALYVERDGRAVKPERLEALRVRLSEVVCRSLRRQVSPFLKVPFVRRSCETMDFSPPGQQSELYDAVTRWLSKPDMVLYRYQARALTTLQVRRRMGSSPRALLFTINAMCHRAEELLSDPEKRGTIPPQQLQRDLLDLRNLKRLADKATQQPDPKLALLLRVLKNVEKRASDHACSDKLVVFTESKRTLESILTHLDAHGFAGKVTSFSGCNDGARAEEALRRWNEEVGQHLSEESRPGPEACQRAALVHEFRTRSRVLVATEAGAKGLNLQFCSCLVNYDLPWNPQRLEQRIGRIHRYGQTHDVVVFNFVNLDNLAERRVYRLLKDKLHLFEGLFGASDEILGLVASSFNLESRIDELLRTSPDIGQAFDELEHDIDELATRCARVKASAHQMLETLRPDVQARLKGIGEGFASSLSRYDEHVVRLLRLDDPDLLTQERSDGSLLIKTRGHEFSLGASKDGGDNLHLDHPYMQRLVAQIVTESSDQHVRMAGPIGGQWQVYRVRFSGFDSEEHLLTLGERGLEEALEGARFLSRQALDGTPAHALLQTAVAQQRAQVEDRQQERTRRRLRLLEGRESDLQKFWSQEESELTAKLEKSRTAQRMAKTAAQARKAQDETKKLRARLTTQQNQRRLRLLELRAKLEHERETLHESKYLTTEVRRLFAVTIEKETP